MIYTSENNPHAKLTPKEVQAIRTLLNQGIPSKDIAEQYKVNPSTISRIKRNKAWKEIKYEK
jgi:DNA-binding MarR family transcriptional regulator